VAKSKSVSIRWHHFESYSGLATMCNAKSDGGGRVSIC